MAITKLPPGFKLADLFTCAICSVSLTLDKATAGLFDGHGHQAFACVSHFSEVEKLILGWADFTANERRKYLSQGQEPDNLIYGGGRNAWLDT
jgi:hypothetical protein